MDHNHGCTNEKLLSMDEILNSLLACSKEECPLEKDIHIYDPKELQSGWQPVSCNPKYIACVVDKRSPLALRNDKGSPSTTHSRKGHTKDKKGLKPKKFAVNFNKCENLGVLSYGVPSWRTIVDPETWTYLERGHPCLANDFGGPKNSQRWYGGRFLDPGGVLDQHLGSFVRRQVANVMEALQSNHQVAGNNVGFGIEPFINDQPMPKGSRDGQVAAAKISHLPQSHLLFPSKILRQPVLRTGMNNSYIPLVKESDISEANSIPQPKTKGVIPPIHINHEKSSSVSSHITSPTQGLSPLLTSMKVCGHHRSPSKSPRNGTQSKSPKPFSSSNKAVEPISLQIVKQKKQDQKLDWLPITSTTPFLPRQTSDDSDTEWSRTTELTHSTINKAIKHLKSQVSERQDVAVDQLSKNVPCRIYELPLTSTGLE